METLPPMALEAEQALLGSLLIDRDAIVLVADRLPPNAFASAANATIYDAVLSLYRERTPTDFVTLSERLQQRNKLEEVGGISYLSTLANVVPTALHVEYYADIVFDAFKRRVVIDVGTEIVRAGYLDLAADPVAILQRAIDAVLALDTGLGGPVPYADLIVPFADRMFATWNGEIKPDVLPTGFAEFDRALRGGLRPSDLIVFAARTGMGKALALDTPIPTPTGWTTMGEIAVGDVVLDEAGEPCRVTAATPVQHDRACYSVRFSDGSEIVADADHRWLTSTAASRKSDSAARAIDRDTSRPLRRYGSDQSHKRARPPVVTTAEIAASVRVGPVRRLNHAVPVALSLQLPPAWLPIPAYTLGAWLGDGSTASGRVTNTDPDVFDQIRRDGYEVGPPYQWDRNVRCVFGLQPHLRAAGVLNNKHIPPVYLRSHVAQRWDLLAGLMDTDGHIDKNGVCEYTSKLERLADDVRELVVSLGMIATVKRKTARCNGKDCGPVWRVRFMPSRQVFRLPHKAERCDPSRRRRTTKERYIVAVDPVPSVPVRCIQVDSPNHLYLCGLSMIPTHNTAFALQLAHNIARRFAMRPDADDYGAIVIFSAEMSTDALLWRGFAEVSGIPQARLETGELSHAEIERVIQAGQFMQRMPVYLDDTPAPTVAQMLSRVQRIQRERPVALVLFDYLELAGDEATGRDGGTEERRVTGVIRAFKRLAKTCRVPVVALSQVSRRVEDRPNKRPRLRDIPWSSAVEAAADVILFAYRHDYYVAQGMADVDVGLENVVEISIGKQRNGATSTHRLTFHPELMAFSEAGDDRYGLTA